MSVEVVTFGCRLNAYESEVIKAQAEKAGQADTIIFNTCAVTSEAERQARQAIRRARRDHPDKQIIVTGCSAQVHPDMYGDMEEVSAVLGNEDKMHARNYLAEALETEPVRVNDIMEVEETASHMISSFDGHTRAFVQVQNGCNHRCTFCIIPFGRGNSRSVPLGEIVREVRALTEKGFKEVVLTGVDISAYGEDLPGTPTLGQLVRRLLAQVPELSRLRISSIDAVEVDDDLYRAIAEEERLMPHMHLSLQAGDDMVLKRMKRRHLRSDALAFCQKVRDLRPDVVFGADIIAGFPTESEEMFANTLRFVEEAELTWLHVFPYSERPGTPAAKMPSVPKAVRKERAARLRALGEQQVQKHLHARVGKSAHVLMEKDGIGRDPWFTPIKLAGDVPAGSLCHAQLTSADQQFVYGEAL